MSNLEDELKEQMVKSNEKRNDDNILIAIASAIMMQPEVLNIEKVPPAKMHDVEDYLNEYKDGFEIRDEVHKVVDIDKKTEKVRYSFWNRLGHSLVFSLKDRRSRDITTLYFKLEDGRVCVIRKTRRLKHGS